MKQSAIVGLLVAACTVSVLLAETKEEPDKKVPEIPGITTADKIPQGCVGCHKNNLERKKDYRLTTTLKNWQTEVKPKRLEMAQAAAPAGVKLKGKHPDVSSLIEVIPDDCMMCHLKGSKTVPPFGKMLHSIHLTGGEKNHFLTSAGGQCTHCHKLDKKTGEWSLGSGEEVFSYQESVDRFKAEPRGSKPSFSADDRAIMKKAGESLARSMPSPGIKVGEKAPDFRLKNAFGKSVRLKDELEKGPVVLVFYRGAWCPFCNIHLSALRKHLPQFQEYGAQLITITPQTPDKSAEQIKKDGLPFEVLSDLNGKVMKDYKLYFELPDDLVATYKTHGLDIEAFNGKGRNGLPVPGSFVIDKNGIVQAMQAQTDYKMRMEPAAIIDALKSISGK